LREEFTTITTIYEGTIMKEKVINSAVRRKYPAVAMDDSLLKVIQTMSEQNSSALVVTVGEELVGIVTVSDIMQSVSAGDDIKETKVSSFMTKCELIASEEGIKTPCVQLDEEEAVVSAIRVMNNAGVNHLLVSGGDGNPVGMVSSLDIVKLLAT
jgi:CBS domain-containing protein